MLKDRVEGALVDGVVVFGGVKERGGDFTFGVEVFGTEKERLPELKLFGAEKDRFAMAGMAKMPNEKTRVTTRARMRLTQVHGRMVPHPSGCIASEDFPIRPDHSCQLS